MCDKRLLGRLRIAVKRIPCYREPSLPRSVARNRESTCRCRAKTVKIRRCRAQRQNARTNQKLRHSRHAMLPINNDNDDIECYVQSAEFS